jgi:hypothetical protein
MQCDVQGDNSAVSCMLSYCLHQLQHSCNVDQVQGLLAVILGMHSNRIIVVPELAELAMELRGSLMKLWAVVDDDIHAIRCLTAVFGKTQL